MSIRTRTPFLADRPVSEPFQIVHIVDTLMGRVDLHPVYQRGISWTVENMCDLVTTVMHNGLLPGLLLYKLQADDEKVSSAFKYECVDGQHRLFVLFHYFNGTPVVINKKEHMITWRHKMDDRVVHVFFKENDNTRRWAAEHRDLTVAYMTEEEQEHFSEFQLDIRTIKNKLTLNQRREIFVSLQKGVPVRGSDLYKNKVDIPLVKFLSEEKRLEMPTKEIFRERLQQKPEKYWLHWLIRMFLLVNSTDRTEAFLTKDSEITDMMKKNNPLLFTTEEQNQTLWNAIARFNGFLESLPVGTKLSHTLFFATFATLLDLDDDAAAKVATHMKAMSQEGTVKQRRLWENRGEPEERKEYFESLVDQISRINTAYDPTARTNVPKKTRLAVWARDCGNTSVGKCFCCAEEVTEKSWECGHIKADACGGLPVLENLRVTCRECNRSMGTEHMDAFKARCYPDVA